MVSVGSQVVDFVLIFRMSRLYKRKQAWHYRLIGLITIVALVMFIHLFKNSSVF